MAKSKVKSSENKAKDVETPKQVVSPEPSKQAYYKVPEDVMVSIRRFLGTCPFDNVVQLVAGLQRVEKVEG